MSWLRKCTYDETWSWARIYNSRCETMSQHSWRSSYHGLINKKPQCYLQEDSAAALFHCFCRHSGVQRKVYKQNANEPKPSPITSERGDWPCSVQTGQKLLFEVEEKYLYQHVKHLESKTIHQNEAKGMHYTKISHHILCTTFGRLWQTLQRERRLCYCRQLAQSGR